MKKLILSISTIILFAVYGYIRDNDSGSGNAAISHNESISTDSSVSVSEGSLTQPISATKTPIPTSTARQIAGIYKDGEYLGSLENAFYGYVQVKAVVSGNNITDVQFLSYPNDRRTSVFINSQATPMLRSEAIKAQSANVTIVSGATDTSRAFIASLSTALTKAE